MGRSHRAFDSLQTFQDSDHFHRCRKWNGQSLWRRRGFRKQHHCRLFWNVSLEVDRLDSLEFLFERNALYCRRTLRQILVSFSFFFVLTHYLSLSPPFDFNSHYDALCLLPTPDAPAEFGTTVFSSHDSRILSAAKQLCSDLKQRHYYTDTATFTLKCNTCKTNLEGEKR